MGAATAETTTGKEDENVQITIPPASEAELLTAYRAIKGRKARALDKIPANVIQSVILNNVQYFTYMFNRIVTSGEFPKGLDALQTGVKRKAV